MSKDKEPDPLDNPEITTGRADGDAWFLEVLIQATNTIPSIQVIGNTSFAATRAKRFNTNLIMYQRSLREGLEIANREVTTLRNQKP